MSYHLRFGSSFPYIVTSACSPLLTFCHHLYHLYHTDFPFPFPFPRARTTLIVSVGRVHRPIVEEGLGSRRIRITVFIAVLRSRPVGTLGGSGEVARGGMRLPTEGQWIASLRETLHRSRNAFKSSTSSATDEKHRVRLSAREVGAPPSNCAVAAGPGGRSSTTNDVLVRYRPCLQQGRLALQGSVAGASEWHHRRSSQPELWEARFLW